MSESSTEGESGASSGGQRKPASETSLNGSGAPAFWTRIHEHKVLQWGLAYLGAALAIAHGAELLGTTFHWPELINRLLMGVLIVGLPIALALAWYHGHRSLRSVSAGEATIISLLVVIGAGLLMVFARAPEEGARRGGPSRQAPSISEPAAAARAASSTGAGSVAAAPKGPSIAVLPFVNMSSDAEQEYFSDGLAEEVLNQLAHVPNLRVIGRTSSFAFKGKNADLRTIGQALGVDHILEGSVRKAGNRVRITAQLIDPANGSHLWSDVYDRRLGDIFAIQEEIARTVAANLRMTMDNDLGEVSTRNLQAYDEYLRAKQAGIGPGRDFTATIAHLERAVELDPQFTAAWVLLTSTYSGALVNLPERTSEWLAKQEVALSHAVALAPESAAVKVALAGRELTRGNLVHAEQLLAAVKDLPPGLSVDGYIGYSVFLMGVGRPREAIEILERLRQAEPLAPFPSVVLQIAYELSGEYEAADSEYERSVALGDTSDLVRGFALVRAMERGNRELVRKASAATGSAPPAEINKAVAAHLDDPRAALVELRRIFNDPHYEPGTLRSNVIALWAGYLGDPVLSLQALRTMPRIGAGGPSQSLLFSLWRPIEKETRRLPGFKDFVRELGLVDYWRTTGKWGDFCRPRGAGDFECR